jgi:hypothetical protein
MVIPQPESDLSLNVMVVGAEIISVLKKKKQYIILDDLLKNFLAKDRRRTKDLFFDALVLLFSLGIIIQEQYKVRLVHGSAQTTLF